MLIPGGFDFSGSPVVTIQVTGDLASRTYQAVVDTGFTGFVELPLFEMVELGLKSQGAANVVLGDGSIMTNLLSTADVRLGSQVESGTILLAESSSGVLVGMAFLRKFRKSLILTNRVVVLYDERKTLDMILDLARDSSR
jgi:predicted aspartyl protease